MMVRYLDDARVDQQGASRFRAVGRKWAKPGYCGWQNAILR
jgi:hypothetical protein